MKIFVINCGSSSIKYQLFDMTDESVLARGLLERVGGEPVLHHSADGGCVDRPVDAPDHGSGLAVILDAIVGGETGVLNSIDEIGGVGHRVVHGGELVTDSVPVDEELLRVIEDNARLAPLHNPANLAGIKAAMSAVPDAVHVAVFDTAFFSTLEPKVYRYAVPGEWYTRHNVRKYGFHGTSHRYVTLRAAELLGKSLDEVHLVTTHLGNGCSMTAVAGGRAVEHSMGMTPLEGLIMGTRSGDVDPAVALFMQSQGLSAQEVSDALNKHSGLVGLSALSNDMRDLLSAAEDGHAAAELAVEMFVHRIVKYVGAYYTVLPALDAVVLTGGIGENSVPVRKRICQGLARLGVVFDERRNIATVAGKAGPISTDESSPSVWVIPTNEELMIARDTRRIVCGEDQCPNAM